jgi:type II secretory pathway component PulM
MESTLLNPLVTFFKQRTPRERVGIVVIGLVFGAIGIYSLVIEPIEEAFAAQSEQYRKLQSASQTVPALLTRYATLMGRSNTIKKFYDSVDIKTSPLTHLEQLIRDVAKVPAGAYKINPREGSQIGGKYAHKIFSVEFETASLENLAAFLKELTKGKQPMLLNQINVDKRISGSVLKVNLEVSGFEAVTKP